MSSLFPSEDQRHDARRTERSAVERERALLLELETLRAENEHLRRSYAQRLSGQPLSTEAASLKFQANLPLALESALDAASQDPSPQTAQLEYEALFSALAGVFPIGVFRTDHAGVLTHVDEQLQTIFALE